jgi:hypothetical protein
MSKVRCPQCYRVKPWPKAFIGKHGNVTQRCARCNSGKRPRAATRSGLNPDSALRIRCTLDSKNRKLGPIPSTMTSACTCPPSCGFFGAGCYGEYSYLKGFWRKTPKDGLNWEAFIQWVRSLPPGQLWRHNVVGDLPGLGERLDVGLLRELAVANNFARARGFTFTHKRLQAPGEAAAVALANILGFTINLSSDSLEDADRRLAEKVAPVVVVLPYDSPTRGLRTPLGAPVAVCPAQTRKGVTCSSCGVCARPKRSGVVGFLAHGQEKRKVSNTVDRRQLPLVG